MPSTSVIAMNTISAPMADGDCRGDAEGLLLLLEQLLAPWK
jgi:hypothetical protein